jgi:hypothetical protein
MVVYIIVYAEIRKSLSEKGQAYNHVNSAAESELVKKHSNRCHSLRCVEEKLQQYMFKSFYVF